MPNVIFRILLLVSLSAIVFGQSHPGIHQVQSEYYRDNYPEPEYPPAAAPALPKVERMLQPTHTVFGYHPYWMGTAWQSYNYNLLTTVAWFSAEVTATGQLSNLHGWPVTDLINLAHGNGVDVVLCATLFDNDDLATLLSNSSYRQNLITNLVNQVKNANGDGVNIDFESMPSSQRSNLVQFMTDLTNTFHSEIPGSQVTMATPAVDWSNAWDYNALANICDGLFIMGYAYYWSGSSYAGPTSPLTGGSYNITNTVNDYLSKTDNNSDKIILGLPYYGYDWAVVSNTKGAAATARGVARFYDEMEALSLTYGRNWDSSSQTPWFTYQSGNWQQAWYDDSLSLSLKYDLALDKELQGIGMWALGYDGSSPKLWEALADKFGAISPPLEPTGLAIRNLGDGSIMVSFSGASSADEYTVVRSYLDQSHTDIIGTFNQRPIIITGLNLNIPHYLKITASNDFGSSPETEVLGTTPSQSDSKILVVHGFDRVSGTNNTRDYTRQHGSAIWQSGYSFDSASNEAVLNGEISLSDYPVVDWILGEEGSTNSTFTGEEQALVKAYLEQGGQLIVSGSEIGYDLVAQGNTEDIAFFNNYLKADYIVDAASDEYELNGATSSIFDGLSGITYDNGNYGTYDVDYPDGIKPFGGAGVCLHYTGADYAAKGAAGIHYSGSFGSSSINGAVILLAVGFEALYPEESRNTLMNRMLGSFTIPNGIIDHNNSPHHFEITSIYPNPSNSAVTIRFTVPDETKSGRLQIVDLAGRIIRDILISGQDTEVTSLHWNGTLQSGQPAPTGVYFARISFDNKTQSRKFTLLK